MLQTEPILRLLAEKKALFLQFEEATERMCFAPVEEIVPCMDRRLEIQQKVEKIDRELETLYCSVPKAKQAASNQCDPNKLTPELKRVYRAALEVKGVVERAMQNDAMVQERIEMEKKSIMKKLEDIKQSSSSVANRYYESMRGGVQRPYFSPGIKKV